MNKLVLATTLVAALSMQGCLKTRSEVAQSEQNYIYRQKNIENQREALRETSKNPSSGNVDQDETIRVLNGRLEVLENQISNLQKENAQLAQSADSAKIATLQEALMKMEAQLQKLEAEKTAAASMKASDEIEKSKIAKSTSLVPAQAQNKKPNSYDVAEDLFNKKDWKSAILSYQKFVEDNPKSKMVPDAKYKTGVCFQELGLKDEALAFYEEVSIQYPQTTAGKKAKIRISKLKKK